MPKETIGKKVDELIKIADSTESSLDEQLDAIKKLGKSKNKEAEDYLRKINYHEFYKTITRSDFSDPYGWPSQYSYIDIEHNPHAKGNLYDVLQVETGYDEWSNTPGPFPSEYHREYPRTKRILDRALIEIELTKEGGKGLSKHELKEVYNKKEIDRNLRKLVGKALSYSSLKIW